MHQDSTGCQSASHQACASDLISSLKCHEIGLNEHESIKKPKSIALKSRGKSSKALKALESEEESTSGDSSEDGNALQQTAISG